MTWSKMGRRQDGTPSFTPARQSSTKPHTLIAVPVPATPDDTPQSPCALTHPSVAPPSTSALLALCLGEEASMQDLASEASQDPALAALFLRAAGGKPSGNQSLSQSILTLGLSEARSLGFATAVLQILPQPLPKQAESQLLEGCLRRAAVAERIAEEAGQSEVWPAFATAFVAELGLMYMAEAHPHLGQALITLSRQPGEERTSAERLMLGTDHGHTVADSPLGAQLPARIREALRQHHGQSPKPLAMIVAAADRVAELAQVPEPLSRMTIAEQAVAVAGGRSPARELLRYAQQRVTSLAASLQLTIPRQVSPDVFLMPVTEHRATSPVRDIIAFKRGRGAPAGTLQRLDNKTQLNAKLQECCDRGEPFSLILLNFDQFGQINDSFGVPAGDLIMETLASGLSNCLNKPTDQIARVEGDTFAVLMPGADGKLGQITAERIRSTIEQRHVNLGGHFRIASSVTLYGGSVSSARARKRRSAEVLQTVTDGLDAAQQRSRNRTTWEPL